MEKIDNFVRHWKRAIFLMIAGGIIGWILWMFLPQNYTAVTRLSVGIDYNRVGKLEDLQEDRILGITEDILHSDAVIEPVFARSGETDYQTFFRGTMTTRTNETWSLAVTSKDPEEAGRLSLLWLDIAYESLQTAKVHALRAEALQNELEGLTRCIQNSVQTNVPAGCDTDPDEIVSQIENLTATIQTELAQSHGLSGAVIIGTKNPGQLEIRQASRSTAADVFFGAITGLLIALAIPWLRKEKEN